LGFDKWLHRSTIGILMNSFSVSSPSSALLGCTLAQSVDGPLVDFFFAANRPKAHSHKLFWIATLKFKKKIKLEMKGIANEKKEGDRLKRKGEGCIRTDRAGGHSCR